MSASSASIIMCSALLFSFNPTANCNGCSLIARSTKVVQQPIKRSHSHMVNQVCAAPRTCFHARRMARLLPAEESRRRAPCVRGQSAPRVTDRCTPESRATPPAKVASTRNRWRGTLATSQREGSLAVLQSSSSSSPSFWRRACLRLKTPWRLPVGCLHARRTLDCGQRLP